MRAEHPYVYPYSATEAGRRNELTLWRESHRANIACRKLSRMPSGRALMGCTSRKIV